MEMEIVKVGSKWRVRVGKEVGEMVNHIDSVNRKLANYERMRKERNDAEVNLKRCQLLLEEKTVNNNKTPL